MVRETFRIDHGDDNSTMVDLAMEAFRKIQLSLELANTVGFSLHYMQQLEQQPHQNSDEVHNRRDPRVTPIHSAGC